jgi:hypothetical protein
VGRRPVRLNIARARVIPLNSARARVIPLGSVEKRYYATGAGALLRDDARLGEVLRERTCTSS